MKRSAICFLALALVFGGLRGATATETTTVIFDGVWWTSLTYDEKVTAVEGMLVGYDAGWSHGISKLALDRRLTGPKANAAEVATVTASPRFARTFGDIVTTIDGIYEGHPSRGKWLVSFFITCAASGKSCKHLVDEEWHPILETE